MNTSNQFSQIAIRIIKKQESIIGPLAWSKAKKVVGLTVDQSQNSITFNGNEGDIINRLVMQYVKLFGRVAYEVCREAVKDLINEMPEDHVPSIFKKSLKFSENKKISETLYEQNLETVVKLEKTQNTLKVQKIVNKEANKVIDEIERELRR